LRLFPITLEVISVLALVALAASDCVLSVQAVTEDRICRIIVLT